MQLVILRLKVLSNLVVQLELYLLVEEKILTSISGCRDWCPNHLQNEEIFAYK